MLKVECVKQGLGCESFTTAQVIEDSVTPSVPSNCMTHIHASCEMYLVFTTTCILSMPYEPFCIDQRLRQTVAC